MILGSCSVTVVHRVTAIYRAVSYIQVRLYKPVSRSANFPTHSLSKVFFAFFDFALADENGQDLFFFFEDTRALIMARKSRVNSACS